MFLTRAVTLQSIAARQSCGIDVDEGRVNNPCAGKIEHPHAGEI